MEASDVANELPLTARERSSALRPSDGKLCPQADPPREGNQDRPTPLESRNPDQLFDDLVRPQYHRGRDSDPECLGSFEVDHEVELCRLLDREIARCSASEDAIYEVPSPPIQRR